jgi:hypothetical protein
MSYCRHCRETWLQSSAERARSSCDAKSCLDAERSRLQARALETMAETVAYDLTVAGHHYRKTYPGIPSSRFKVGERVIVSWMSGYEVVVLLKELTGFLKPPIEPWWEFKSTKGCFSMPESQLAKRDRDKCVQMILRLQ